MYFHEKLISLRKARGLSQAELGHQIGVSRQTISKWELGQSFPDFQKLVSLGDYFEISLDALVKDVDVQNVREENESNRKISSIYHDVQTVKKAANMLLNFFAAFGVLGIIVLLAIIFLRG